MGGFTGDVDEALLVGLETGRGQVPVQGPDEQNSSQMNLQFSVAAD